MTWKMTKHVSDKILLKQVKFVAVIGSRPPVNLNWKSGRG